MTENLWLQPSSDGFPEGLLDQPFYGWGEVHLYELPALAGFTGEFGVRIG
jgi:hypothetical protein